MLSIATDIALSVLKKHWKVIVVAALAVALLFSVQSCKKYQDELLVAEDNYQAVISEKKQTAIKQRLTTKQLKQSFQSELATLRDSLSIKPKQITRLQTIRTVEHDTVISFIKVKPATKFNVATFDKDCTNGSFIWIDGDSLGTFTITNNNDFLVADHWERRKLFGWGWTPRWGKKRGNVSVVNLCNNDTIIENKVIEIDG